MSIAVIITLAMLHFFLVLDNDFSLDDTYYLQQVEEVKSWKDVWSVTHKQFSFVDYRPLPSLSFAIEKVLSGGILNPKVSHGINLLLYIIGALIMLLFHRRFQNVAGTDKDFSLPATLLFVSLPLHASMVANIKSRDGLLSFALGLSFLHLLLITLTEKGNLKRLISIVAALVCIIAAAYSKLDGLNFLFAAPLLVLLVGKKLEWKQIIRFVLVALISYRFFQWLFNLWISKRTEVIISNAQGEPMLEDPLFFTENPIVVHKDLPTRLAFAIQTVFEYLLMVFKPVRHYFYYGYDMVKVLPLSSPIIWLKGSIILFILILAIWLFLKKDKITAFGIAFFFISLVYCSNLITPVAGIVADRYAFIASMGACIALSGLLSRVSTQILKKMKTADKSSINTTNLKDRKKTAKATSSKMLWSHHPENISLAIVLAISLIYLPFNISRSKDWKNHFSLFEADMPRLTHLSYEANRIAMRNYIETAIDSDNPSLRNEYFSKGLEYGTNALRIYPDGKLAQEGIILAYRGLDRFDLSLAWARHVAQKFDTSEVAWRVLTDYYYFKGYLDSAAFGYRKLVDIVSNDPNVYFFYVTALQEANKLQDALKFCDSLEATKPNDPLPHQARSYLYLNAKDSANAVIQIEKGFEKGWRDNQMLDIMGMYWWTRDKEKWESLKRYLQ